jgi:hypothetical protein
MQSSLAEAFTQMEDKDLGALYTSELLAWQQMQCEVGYTGDLCGTCMPGLTPAAAAAFTQATKKEPSEVEMLGFGRYGFRCVQCKAFGRELVVLLTVFTAQAVYIAVGVMLQVRAPHKMQLIKQQQGIEGINSVPSGDNKGQQQQQQRRGSHLGAGAGDPVKLDIVMADMSDVQATRDPALSGKGIGSIRGFLGLASSSAPERADDNTAAADIFSPASCRPGSREKSFWGQFLQSGQRPGSGSKSACGVGTVATALRNQEPAPSSGVELVQQDKATPSGCQEIFAGPPSRQYGVNGSAVCFQTPLSKSMRLGGLQQCEKAGGEGNAECAGHMAAAASGGSVECQEQKIVDFADASQKQMPAATLLAIWKVLTNYIQVSPAQ